MIPRIAILGRPNVGKSTLFNRLLRRKEAIIHPQAGVTRDRKDAKMILEGSPVMLMDTGGIFPDEADDFSTEIQEQVNAALSECHYVLFLVEATGVTGGDEEMALFLRKKNLPVLVVVNKCDRMKDPDNLAEFYSLGFPNVIPVSAEHGRYTAQLKTRIAEELEELALFNIEDDSEQHSDDSISFALIGRPNVGKSSLLNCLVRRERSIVSPVAGTTRDSVEDRFHFQDKLLKVIDTAGLRRKSKVKESVEFYSTLRAKNSISSADVTVLLIEPDTLITDQDKKICDVVMDAGKGLIFAINKWDTVDEASDQLLRKMKSRIRFKFPELEYVPILTMSAVTGRGVKKLLNLIITINNHSARTLTTSELNKFVEQVVSNYKPSKKGKQLKIYYAVQTGASPPRFTFFVNNAKIASPQYRNYVKNTLRKNYDFTGVPIFIHIRDKKG